MPPGYGRPVTTSPRDQARLNDALDELTDALEAHLAACIESTGEADAAVQATDFAVGAEKVLGQHEVVALVPIDVGHIDVERRR